MADLYDSYSSAGDPGGGRDATKFYAYDAKQHADAINANTHALTIRGARSALPSAAAGNTGARYECSDCNAVYLSDGSAWTKIRMGDAVRSDLTDPPGSGWSTNTLGSATFAADKDARLLTIPSAAGDNYRLEYRTLSPTSGYTATAYIETAFEGANFFQSGLALYDTASVKMVVFGPAYSSTQNYHSLAAYKYTNATTFSAAYKVAAISRQPNWLRIKDDGTNRLLQFSANGIDWETFYSVGRTDFLTPTSIGWFGDNSSGVTHMARMRHFAVS